MQSIDMWSDFDNVSSPTHFTEDFSVDNGYFNEENGASDWSYANGAMTAIATDRALSYIHVYEPDVTYTAKLRIQYTAPI